MSVASVTNHQDDPERSVHIRLLATTDLHGHLLRHDYIKDQPTQAGGLAGLGHLIGQARTQAQKARMPVILLDNGDTFQGTPLACDLASQDVCKSHPIVTAINHLAYDALGLGNHDLDHGLPYLKAVAAELDMPLVNSNIGGIDISPLRESVLLSVDTGDAAPISLTLGILSVLPMQSANWHSHHLGHEATVEAPDTTIQRAAAELRRQGADLIVVLGHMGVGDADSAACDLLASHALVRTGDVDALILGHTHRRFPSDDYATRKGVDVTCGTIGGVPALMAGHAGSDLGVMDLELTHTARNGWQIKSHRSSLRPNDASIRPDPQIVAAATSAHVQIRKKLSEQVALTDQPLHSYFSLVAPAPTQRLTALAQYRQIKAALPDTTDANLPILSSAAAHGAGGRDGLANYIHIRQGPVLRRHIAGLNPFANQTVGIRISGVQLHNWLEHAALLFNRLSIENPTQMLRDENIPAFQFDTIFGLHYVIDPTAAPYARISDIRYEGEPVAPDQMFVLATSQFRATGGGSYPSTVPSDIVCCATTSLTESMIDVLNHPQPDPWDATPPWHFARLGGIKANVLTHPDAVKDIADIARLSPRYGSETDGGFIRIAITL